MILKVFYLIDSTWPIISAEKGQGIHCCEMEELLSKGRISDDSQHRERGQVSSCLHS